MDAAAARERLREAVDGRSPEVLERIARAMHDGEAPPGRDASAAWEADAKAQGVWLDRARRALRAILADMGTPEPVDSASAPVPPEALEREWTEG